jgi:subtilisin-like proprotein convertase family protein
MAAPMLPIPDNSTTGASSTIAVAGAGGISSLAVTVDVQHTYRGDLRLELVHGGRTVTLLDRQGAGEDDVRQTFSVADFNAMDAAGDWTLRVVDTAAQDTGTLRSWSIQITRCSGTCGGSVDATHHYASTQSASIPDNSTTGASTDIVVSDAGTIRTATVTVDLTHPYLRDLTIRVSRVGGREFVLLRQQSITGTSLHRTFDVAGFAGEMAPGTYRLTVVDGAARDVGTIDGWSLDLTTH